MIGVELCLEQQQVSGILVSSILSSNLNQILRVHESQMPSFGFVDMARRGTNPPSLAVLIITYYLITEIHDLWNHFWAAERPVKLPLTNKSLSSTRYKEQV